MKTKSLIPKHLPFCGDLQKAYHIFLRGARNGEAARRIVAIWGGIWYTEAVKKRRCRFAKTEDRKEKP